MTMKIDRYRGWTLSYDPKPIPIRDCDWTAFGPNYDASWHGEEDGWVDSGDKASAATREELIEEIDAWFEENEEPRTAKTAKQAECEASQSGPQGNAQKASG